MGIFSSAAAAAGGGLTYWLAEHPAIVGFRWSHAHSWGSTWSFLVCAIAAYVLAAAALHSLLTLLGRRRPLSRFLHLLRTFLLVARRRVGRPGRSLASHLFVHAALVCTSFVWLEFSQSLQVTAILSTTVAYAVVYGYRFWVEVGLPWGGTLPAVLGRCQALLVACNLLSHLGLLLLHFCNGGCNGIGAWVFNSVLNAALLLLFAAKGRRARNWEGIADDDCSTHHHSRRGGGRVDLVKED